MSADQKAIDLARSQFSAEELRDLDGYFASLSAGTPGVGITDADIIELAENFSSEYQSDVGGQFWGFNEATLLEFARAVAAKATGETA